MEKMAHFIPFKASKNRWLSIFLVLGILLVAAFLRLYKIGDYLTFLGDEGRDVLVVYNILHGKLTLLGPTSSVGGFFLGPIYYYLMAPFLWLFNYDPVGPAVMVGLFGVITVFLVYKIGNEFFGKAAGIVAAILYAISPLVIAYSRSSWNPNLMPITSLLCLYILYKAIVTKNKWYFVLCGFLLGIAMQLHYLSTFLAVIIVLYIFIANTVESNREYLASFLKSIKTNILVFVGFVVGWSPFLAFEARHEFLNIKSILRFVLASEDVGSEGGNFFATVLNVVFRLFARLVAKYPPPEQVSIRAHGDIAIWFGLVILLMVVALGVFLHQYKEVIKKKSNDFYKYTLLFVWLIVGIFLFGFYKKPIYDYYFQFMFPLPFLLVGNAFSFLWQKNYWLKLIGVIGLAILIWINVTGIPFRSAPNRQKDQVKHIADFVLSKTDNKPYNFALLTLGNSDHGYRYFFKLAEKDPVTIDNPQNDPERKSVTDQLLIVCEDHGCQPLGAAVWEVAGFGRAEIAEKWDVSVVKIYKLVQYKGPQ